MKKILAIITATAITAMAGAAMANDTNTLTVTASVTGACKFSSTTSSLDFGTIDPAGTTDITGQTKIAYWCTKGVTQTIAADDGSFPSGTIKRMQNGTTNTEYLPYELALTHPAASLNNGPGTLLDLTIDGTVKASDYRVAAAGAYNDVVEITITP